MPTFEQKDYLCIVPFAWARSGKSARDAYRMALSNMPGSPYVRDKRKAPAMIWRLSDEVDEVEVNDLGGFTYRPGEGFTKADVEARLVYKDFCNKRPSEVPEQLLEAIEK